MEDDTTREYLEDDDHTSIDEALAADDTEQQPKSTAKNKKRQLTADDLAQCKTKYRKACDALSEFISSVYERKNAAPNILQHLVVEPSERSASHSEQEEGVMHQECSKAVLAFLGVILSNSGVSCNTLGKRRLRKLTQFNSIGICAV